MTRGSLSVPALPRMRLRSGTWAASPVAPSYGCLWRVSGQRQPSHPPPNPGYEVRSLSPPSRGRCL